MHVQPAADVFSTVFLYVCMYIQLVVIGTCGGSMLLLF